MNKQVFISVIFLLFALFSNAQVTILDNFTDGNFTTNPTWNIQSGTCGIALNQIQNTSTSAIISTPFSIACEEWAFEIDLETDVDAFVRYYFYLKDSPNPANSLADGYYVHVDGYNRIFTFRRLDNASAVILISYTASSNIAGAALGIKVVKTNDTWELFVNNISRGTASDATYDMSQCQYQAIWITAGIASDNHRVDNITYKAVSTLPIELTNFDYSCNNETLKLNWSTASETNNDYFLVLGSADGMEWIEVGKIAGGNNSNNTLNYNFNIPKHYSNLNYYKLKQVDFDNSYSYSNILYVDCQSKNKIEIFPNPFADELNLKVYTNELVPYQISTILNQVVNSGYVNSESSTIKLSELPSGIYFIKVNNSNSHKIIKQ
jgi:hypothetical protein